VCCDNVELEDNLLNLHLNVRKLSLQIFIWLGNQPHSWVHNYEGPFTEGSFTTDH